ncbi:hypothetical protein DFJ73DRAFT_783209 [Zopfochytrium polystomum]|nr:hypothetical protein DFJ73DRAFT_783209 [Zopfochytrium polystomum]
MPMRSTAQFDYDDQSSGDYAQADRSRWYPSSSNDHNRYQSSSSILHDAAAATSNAASAANNPPRGHHHIAGTDAAAGSASGAGLPHQTDQPRRRHSPDPLLERAALATVDAVSPISVAAQPYLYSPVGRAAAQARSGPRLLHNPVPPPLPPATTFAPVAPKRSDSLSLKPNAHHHHHHRHKGHRRADSFGVGNGSSSDADGVAEGHHPEEAVVGTSTSGGGPSGSNFHHQANVPAQRGSATPLRLPVSPLQFSYSSPDLVRLRSERPPTKLSSPLATLSSNGSPDSAALVGAAIANRVASDASSRSRRSVTGRRHSFDGSTLSRRAPLTPHSGRSFTGLIFDGPGSATINMTDEELAWQIYMLENAEYFAAASRGNILVDDHWFIHQQAALLMAEANSRVEQGWRANNDASSAHEGWLANDEGAPRSASISPVGRLSDDFDAVADVAAPIGVPGSHPTESVIRHSPDQTSRLMDEAAMASVVTSVEAAAAAGVSEEGAAEAVNKPRGFLAASLGILKAAASAASAAATAAGAGASAGFLMPPELPASKPVRATTPNTDRSSPSNRPTSSARRLSVGSGASGGDTYAASRPGSNLNRNSPLFRTESPITTTPAAPTRTPFFGFRRRASFDSAATRAAAASAAAAYTSTPPSVFQVLDTRGPPPHLAGPSPLQAPLFQPVFPAAPAPRSRSRSPSPAYSDTPGPPIVRPPSPPPPMPRTSPALIALAMRPAAAAQTQPIPYYFHPPQHQNSRGAANNDPQQQHQQQQEELRRYYEQLRVLSQQLQQQHLPPTANPHRPADAPTIPTPHPFSPFSPMPWDPSSSRSTTPHRGDTTATTRTTSQLQRHPAADADAAAAAAAPPPQLLPALPLLSPISYAWSPSSASSSTESPRPGNLSFASAAESNIPVPHNPAALAHLLLAAWSASAPPTVASSSSSSSSSDLSSARDDWALSPASSAPSR